MEKFNFDRLMNIEVPQSCIEKALKIPAETKKAATPVRFYRFAAGIAACVVIAAAVILSLVLGLNKNVDFTAPDPDPPSRSDFAFNGTEPSSADGISSPSKTSPPLLDIDAQGSTAVTEPEENSGERKQDSAYQNIEKIADVPDSTEPGNKAKQKATKPDNVSEPTETEETESQYYTQPCADNPTQSSSAASAKPRCCFEAVTSLESAGGDVYCRLEDENGAMLGGGELFDKSRITNKDVLNNGAVLLSYVVDPLLAEKADGKIFAVIFYNSSGSVIKKSMPVTVYKDLYFKFN